MKKFLKQKGGADLYPQVKIEWIRGHNPDLYVYDGGTAEGKASRVIDLSKYNYKELHKLFEVELGFRKEAPAAGLRGAAAKGKPAPAAAAPPPRKAPPPPAAGDEVTLTAVRPARESTGVAERSEAAAESAAADTPAAPGAEAQEGHPGDKRPSGALQLELAAVCAVLAALVVAVYTLTRSKRHEDTE